MTFLSSPFCKGPSQFTSKTPPHGIYLQKMVRLCLRVEMSVTFRGLHGAQYASPDAFPAAQKCLNRRFGGLVLLLLFLRHRFHGGKTKTVARGGVR